MAQTVIRIPINNVKGGGDYAGEISVGSQGAIANVILDTGSSTLAVVPRAYKIADDKNATVTPFAQLVTYGTGGWSGPVLETTLSMGSGANQASVKTYIAIADEQLPHNLGPADGILGLAFNALNSAYDLTAYLTGHDVSPPVTHPWDDHLRSDGHSGETMTTERERCRPAGYLHRQSLCSRVCTAGMDAGHPSGGC